MTLPEVTVVDYDSGNVFGVSRALAHLGGNVNLTGDPDAIANAERLILPGVGAFHAAWTLLDDRGLIEPIRAFVATGRPFLGICVGMQLLLEEGTEFGRHPGFGFVGGAVERIDDTGADGAPHRVPRVGWYALRPGPKLRAGSVMARMDDDDAVYFVHSFAARPTDEADVATWSDYNGRTITAAVERDNVLGVQFHPERSGASGLKLLSGFLEQS
ncbi:MAG: imidazole glycerol phosphate synthase subunit HisH [Rhodospirillales bacterium]